ncbi:hypothetical protein F5884DRAFT_777426 [Xylogone sp. PMI_703]|nr:hypothetical protein F5884DRAFT_777426 [Xylogone sp. PMI_703]
MAMDIDQDQNGMWKNIRDLEKKNQELREQLTKNKIELTEIREQKNMNENLAGHTQAMMDSLHTQVGELAKENQLLRMEREKNMQNTNQLGIISTMNSLEADLEGLRKNFEKSQEQINALQEDYGSYGAKSIITDAGIAQELQKLRARRDEAEAKVRAYESSETDLMNEILETSQKYEDLKVRTSPSCEG